jgi:outer membrane protein assembly factor BamB
MANLKCRCVHKEFCKKLGRKMMMKIQFNKTKTSIIALVLTLTISATLLTLPVVNAHDPPWEIPTYIYLALSRDVVGRGQTMAAVFWSFVEVPTAMGAYGDRWTYTVEVTKPDGSKETLGPIKSDPVGAAYTMYTPDQVGTYSFIAIFHEYTITGEPEPPPGTPARAPETIGDVFLEATSNTAYLEVQEEPIEGWVEPPVTEDYWERPLNMLNRDWYVLAANWLDGAAQTNGPTTGFQWGRGPESAHIMWTTPMWAGGIMDARFGPIGYQTSHYEGMSFTPPIIINGKIYYNIRSHPREGYRVLDLYTGEELWFHNTTGPVVGAGGGFDAHGEIRGERLAFGQIYNYESPNQHGGFPYIWSTNAPTSNTWMMFDAETGNYQCSIANVSARGTQVYGKDGSILYYNLDTRNNRLTCWNNTYAIWYQDTWRSNEFWMWRPYLNHTFDGNNGFSLNVSIPDVSGSIMAVREGEFIIGGTEGANNPEEGIVPANFWCLSLKPGEEGTLLWNRTFTPPYSELGPEIGLISGSLSWHGMDMSAVVPEYDVVLFEEELTMRRWGYSLTTGEKLWGPTEPESVYGLYGMSEKIYDGKLISYISYGGEMTCYNITTGEVLWTYTAEGIGYESPYGDYPIRIQVICDGKIYTQTSEHSDTHPLYRGPNLRCIDADTGDEIWKMPFFDSDAVISDGYLVALNSLDMQIYCIGKGPSKTTVTVQDNIISKGDSVMITGTVTDQSPGAKTTEVMAKSSCEEGVPCIADGYMSEWMEYLYQQQAIPADASGVPVTLDAIDPNGNFIHIDTVTSDMSGMFKKMWTPETEGEYTIMATFEGSKSYSSSYSETAIGVGPAQAPSGPIEPEPTAEAPFITTEVAILIAAVIVAVAVIVGFWIIRKRK